MDVPNQGIAPRADQRESGSYAWGQVDCKIAKEGGDNYWIINGPTTSPSVKAEDKDRFQPYKWQQYPQINHQGMAQEFNFKWQLIFLDPELKSYQKINLRAQ